MTSEQDVIVISDDEDEDKEEKQERAREEYGIAFEQYYNLKDKKEKTRTGA